ncbi:hypothetical protein [Pseudomonas amygdali]|uniref:Uncharacterized protein n=1 Tax=Pseudomonas amygdali pv. lachrymans str. M301315 TaxID=629260 RepID=A0AAD0PX29_PSEAV|nr:hypothetical protein [Pseudomonas amygdali]AXH60344.1 hypothetical protein PLA107_034805 [Pseudomonas amygdali pv. lachrymans str. M301315]RMT08663.1 hypothetical protein ALP54_02282 [Pseudomonas amygdali pv. lachrymans]
MNKVMTYQDMSFADYTPLLADSIQQLLAKGLVLQHEKMTVVSSTAGQGFIDPISKNRELPERTGIYSRDAIGIWRNIGDASQMDDLAMYLAMNTPSKNRYSLMVELIEKASAASIQITRPSSSPDHAMQP